MDNEIKEALDRYSDATPGDLIPKEDRQAVHYFLIHALAESGLTNLQAVRLVQMTERGSWNDGWFAGYESGKQTATPHFSLKEN